MVRLLHVIFVYYEFTSGVNIREIRNSIPLLSFEFLEDFIFLSAFSQVLGYFNQDLLLASLQVNSRKELSVRSLRVIFFDQIPFLQQQFQERVLTLDGFLSLKSYWR